MDKITITKEMLAAASDYMTSTAKEAWISENAPKCFDRLSITAGDDPMPPMYMINAGLKARYLMTALAYYLKQPFETDEKDNSLMSETDYDRWAGSHAINQIERWKSDRELRDKCFDLLSDYHELEKRFSAQLYGLLNVQNDFVLRQSQYSAAQMKELPQLLTQLKEMQEAKADGNGES